MIYPRPVDHFRKIEWKFPFICAISLHLLIVIGSVYAPEIFKAKPKFAEVYTVSLVNISTNPGASAEAPKSEVKPSPPAKIEKEVEKVKQPEKVPPPEIKAEELKPEVKKVAPIADKIMKPTPEVEKTPEKVISLAPRKQKVKKNVEPEPDPRVVEQQKRQEEARKRAQEKKEAEELARKQREKEFLEKQAQLAREKARLAQEALDEERALLRSSAATSSLANRQTNSPQRDNLPQGDGGGGTSSVIESQYYAAIKSKLLSYWALPVNLQNRPDLEATVVVTINNQGTIIDMFFEKRSGERVFDQFVEKTINAANPFPPMPAAMRKQQFEMGLKFSPKGIR